MFALSALLAACCPEPLTKTELVEVPIAVKCKVEIVKRPDMPYDALDNSATLFEKTKALLIQNYNLKAYSAQLNASLEGCAN